MVVWWGELTALSLGYHWANEMVATGVVSLIQQLVGQMVALRGCMTVSLLVVLWAGEMVVDLVAGSGEQRVDEMRGADVGRGSGCCDGWFDGWPLGARVGDLDGWPVGTLDGWEAG